MKNKLLGVLGMLVMAVPLMGNQGCNEPAAQERMLKKKVELGKIQSRNFTLPGGDKFDFEFVINAQAYEVLADSPNFILPYSSPTAAVASSVPACVREYPNMRIAGAVNGFEFTTGIGVKFGYSPDGNLDGTSVEASVKVDISELDLAVVGHDPLTGFAQGTGVAKPNETRTKIGVTVDFSEFSIGPEFFFKSALSNVTRKGLQSAFEKLAENTKQEPWFAQVVEDKDKEVVINAGRRSGIVVGDKFQVYNVDHYWMGAPCQSAYRGMARRTATPIRHLLITSVSSDMSVGKVIAKADYTDVDVGAEVSILELYVPPKEK